MTISTLKMTYAGRNRSLVACIASVGGLLERVNVRGESVFSVMAAGWFCE
jgi:hypothetical protein